MRAPARLHKLSYGSGATGAAGQYDRLFRVAITHGYYTQDKGRCPALRAAPTDATAALLGSLGLVFKDEGDGFSVFFRPANLSAILRYLENGAAAQRNGAGGGVPGYWGRLTFLLELADPEFVGVSALPIEMRLTDENLYGSNRYAHGSGGGSASQEGETALLSEGRFMDGTALRPVITGELSFAAPDKITSVVVLDISGAVVLHWPDDKDEAAESAFGAASAEPVPQQVTLDFGSLAHGLYTIVARIGDTPGDAREVLYVPPGAESVVLLDMLFTQPTAEDAGIYPIPSLYEGAPLPERCGHILYRLPFEARHTYWQYYVVSRVPGSRLVDLEIGGQDAVFTPEQEPVLLPDGSWATLFTTPTTLPLREKSGQRFRLTGRRLEPSGHENPILVTRLPVAPAVPVWPGPVGESETGRSEMFVYV